MNKITLGTAALSLCLSVSAPVFAQNYQYGIVAQTSVDTYRAFGTPTLSEFGTVAFRADQTDGTFRLLLGRPGQLKIVATAGPAETFSRFATTAPSLGKFGQRIAFTATLNAGGSAVYLWTNGSTPTLTAIADTTDASQYVSVAAPSVGRDGFVAFLGGLKSGGQGIFVGDGTETLTIADNVSAGSLFSSFSAPSLNGKDTVAFAAQLTDGTSGIYRYQGQALGTVADSTGTLATFSFSNPALSTPYFGAESLAFTARFDVGGAGVFRADVATGALTPVADSTGAYANITLPSLNSFGKPAFLATLDAGGSGIFTGADPVADKVVQTGDALLGSTVNSVSLSQDAINDFGQVAFQVSLADGRRMIVIATPVCP
ncbi:MAG: hypothetical protein H7145_08645 [Akkermansiaceae bacterium]|nr:hypothetical protein [Armatimonadota bacterium]